jgi:hypothetical protein
MAGSGVRQWLLRAYGIKVGLDDKALQRKIWKIQKQVKVDRLILISFWFLGEQTQEEFEHLQRPNGI